MYVCQSNGYPPVRGRSSRRLLVRLLLLFTSFTGRTLCTKWHIRPMLLPQTGKHSCSGRAAAAAVLRSDDVVGTAVLCCNSASTALVCYDWVSVLERGVGCDVAAVGGLGVVCRRRLAGQREGREECGRGHVSLYAEHSLCLGTANSAA